MVSKQKRLLRLRLRRRINVTAGFCIKFISLWSSRQSRFAAPVAFLVSNVSFRHFTKLVYVPWCIIISFNWTGKDIPQKCGTAITIRQPVQTDPSYQEQVQSVVCLCSSSNVPWKTCATSAVRLYIRKFLKWSTADVDVFCCFVFCIAVFSRVSDRSRRDFEVCVLFFSVD